MKEHLLSAIGFIALGFLMILGRHLTEYTPDRPLPTVMICSVEEETAAVHCTPFEEYPTDERQESQSPAQGCESILAGSSKQNPCEGAQRL